MLKENLSKHISNHPFVFLISVVLIASCCLGGLFIPSLAGTVGSTQVFSPVVARATVQSSTIAVSTPSATETLEITATNLPGSPKTETETPGLEHTATNTQFAPTSTVILVPTNASLPLTVTFINVGQGDSILIESPEGQTALIDGGSAGKGALDYLLKAGVKKIDIMIATHPHEDHIGGLVEVLNALPVKKVITNGEMYTTSVYEHFLDAVTNARAEYVEVARGDIIKLGSLKFSVLNPSTIIGDDMNHNSLVLRMEYGKTTFMFMGDADKNAEGGILAAGLPVKSDILKIGHHGSCNSSSPAFLDAVKPVVAVYSAGLGNPYGHPCSDTISALNARGIFILGTDVNGSIIVTVTTDGYVITNTDGQVLRR